jgi:hypothetical protein
MTQWSREIICEDCGEEVILETDNAYISPVGTCKKCGAIYVEIYSLSKGYILIKNPSESKKENE